MEILGFHHPTHPQWCFDRVVTLSRFSRPVKWIFSRSVLKALNFRLKLQNTKTMPPNVFPNNLASPLALYCFPSLPADSQNNLWKPLNRIGRKSTVNGVHRTIIRSF